MGFLDKAAAPARRSASLFLVFTGSDPTLTGLYAAAGLAGINGNGFTFNDAGTSARLVNNPTRTSTTPLR